MAMAMAAQISSKRNRGSRTSDTDTDVAGPTTSEEGVKVPPLRQALEAFVEVIIVLNAAQMGICAAPQKSDALNGVCDLTEHSFTAIFLCEFLVKIWFFGRMYWSERLNILDFFLVVVAVADGWVLRPLLDSNDADLRNILMFRLIRINRLFRLLRVVNSRKHMALLLASIRESFNGLMWVALLMLLLIYCSAIFCVISFSDVELEGQLTFETVPRAMFTMFTLAIVADWTPFVDPVIKEYWWASLFFILFIVVATFMGLNLIIGVISERTAAVQHEYKCSQERLKELAHMEGVSKIAEIIFSTQDDATITREEMEEMVQGEEHGPHIQALVAGVSLPAGYEVTDCHAMFDRDSSGSITQEEFEQGMRRLIFGNDFQRSLLIQSAISDVMIFTSGFEDRITAQITAEFAKLRQELNIAPAASSAGASAPPTISGEGQAGTNWWSPFACNSGPPPGELETIPRKVPEENVPLTREQLEAKAANEKLAKVAQHQADLRLRSCQSIVDRLREPLSVYLAEAIIKDCELLPSGPGYDRLPRTDMDADSNVFKKSGVIGGKVIESEPQLAGGKASTVGEGALNPIPVATIGPYRQTNV